METEQQAYERQAYEIPGQQLRWRAAQLQQQGLPYNIQPLGGGIYIVIVQQPVGANPFAYTAPSAARQRGPDTASMVRVAGVVVVVAAAGYIAYALMGGAALLPANAEPGMRNLFARTMDGIGLVLLVGVFGLCAWMARPLLGSFAGMVRSAAALAGRLRK